MKTEYERPYREGCWSNIHDQIREGNLHRITDSNYSFVSGSFTCDDLDPYDVNIFIFSDRIQATLDLIRMKREDWVEPNFKL
jgi:hypothetical protein